MKFLRIALVVALASSLALLSGCAARSAEQSAEPAVQAVNTVGAPVAADESVKHGISVSSDLGRGSSYSDAASPQTDGTVISQPMIIRNASLDIRVKDIDRAIAKLRAAVASRGGEIAEMSVTGGDTGGIPLERSADNLPGPTYASIIVRLPAAKLDSLADSVEGLGTLLSRTESSSDVTEQAIDMEARIKNLRAEEVRLRSFLSRTNKVSELLAVEAQLARVRGEIESMDAQLTYLKRQVARATLAITLSEPGAVTGSESPWFSLREAFARGVQGAFGVVEGLVTFIVAALPLLVLVGLVAWAIRAVLRRRYKRRQAATAADNDVSDAEPADTETGE